MGNHTIKPKIKTLQFLSPTLPSELRGGTWQVTRVVKPDELGKPEERLREQMKKLELSQEGQTPLTFLLLQVSAFRLGSADLLAFPFHRG